MPLHPSMLTTALKGLIALQLSELSRLSCNLSQIQIDLQCDLIGISKLIDWMEILEHLVCCSQNG